MVTVDRSSVGRRLAAFFVVCILAAGVSACSDITGVPTSNVQVLLTGAQVRLTAAPSDMIASAEVWISHVYLQGGGDDTADETGRVDLFNDPKAPLHFDLLTLQDGITADLTGLVEVEAELYQGLRLVVDRTRVTLVEGLELVDGTNTATLMVPSGSQSGIKVKLNDEIDAADGESMTLTVDFDVDRNFVIQGSRPGSECYPRDSLHAGSFGTRARPLDQAVGASTDTYALGGSRRKQKPVTRL